MKRHAEDPLDSHVRNSSLYLDVSRRDLTSGPVPQYQKPVEIANYSLDHERKLHFDNRSMSYYFPVDLSDTRETDLCVGFPDTYVERENIPEHLDTLIDTIMHSCESALDGTNFVTWRGIMTRIFCAPYSRDAWEFSACRYKDTIFIEEPLPPSFTEQHNTRQRLMCYWGYRFEVVSTIPCDLDQLVDGRVDSRVRSRVDTGVNTNIQYCVVSKTKLGTHSIIMGAEVDCISRDENGQNVYIELKTSKEIETEKDRMSFEKYKLLKFYAQSFLIGIPKIYVGFRTNHGSVASVQSLETLRIPRIVRDKGYWDPNENIASNDPSTLYTISFAHPFRSIEVTKTSGDPFLPPSLLSRK